MNEQEKAKLKIKIANEEYSKPDFGFRLKNIIFSALAGFGLFVILHFVLSRLMT